jgi:hypothetical protein
VKSQFKESLTNAALPAFLGTVLAILTILARMTRVGTCAGRCGSAQWHLAEEKNRQHDLSKNNEQFLFLHG